MISGFKSLCDWLVNPVVVFVSLVPSVVLIPVMFFGLFTSQTEALIFAKKASHVYKIFPGQCYFTPEDQNVDP